MSSSIISVPEISPGIKSGVNCILENFKSNAFANVRMSKVFASPGTPINSTCPRAKRAINNCSIISFCPIITLPISDLTL